VRQEVQRREADVARTMQESAAARRVADSFYEAVRPYEAMIRAEGGNPIGAVQDLLQTAAALRTSPPAHRAQLVAQLIRDYGVPIEALDAALVGRQAPQGQQGPQQGPAQDPRLDQLLARIERAERERAESTYAEGASEVESFGANKEFFHDVRPLMADIIEVASRRGEQLDLQQAYDRAIAMTPDIAKVVAQRQAAANAANRARSTQRARAAASSPRSTPSVSPRTDKGERSLRDELEDAVESLSGR
jgi:hypothetical protein